MVSIIVLYYLYATEAYIEAAEVRAWVIIILT